MDDLPASAVISVKTLAVAPNWQVVGFDGTTTPTQANLIWQTPGVATKAVVKVARPGDHLLCMSNGGFGGVHEKLLAALADHVQ